MFIFVTFLLGDDGVSLGPLEAGFLGSSLALVVFLVILSVIIIVLCVKCEASTKRYVRIILYTTGKH